MTRQNVHAGYIGILNLMFYMIYYNDRYRVNVDAVVIVAVVDGESSSVPLL